MNNYQRTVSRLLAVIIAAAPLAAGAQNSPSGFLDSAKLNIGSLATFASQDYQPFWIISNRWGSVVERKADASMYLDFSNSHVIGDRESNTDEMGVDPITLSYGFTGLLNNQFNKGVAQQAYGRLSFRGWEFSAGRIKNQIGEQDRDLSTGSLGVSQNALPIPQIRLAITEWRNVPWTRGFARFKGSFSHGWMGGDRYLSDGFYHEKSLYVQILRNKLKLYGGLQHFAEWGGRRGNLELDRDLQGFLNVLLVKEAYDGGGLPSYIRPGRAGDQRGLLEFGADWEDDDVRLHLYNQVPFETGIGIDIRNIDRLLGVSAEWKERETGFQKVLVEFVHTKQMEDYGREVHSYYNNGNYRTGWEYKDRVIGTPLMINRNRAQYYFPTIKPLDYSQSDTIRYLVENIVSNRLVALSVGAVYKITPTLTSKTNLTVSRNYGSLYPNEFTTPHQNQFYGYQELKYQGEGRLGAGLGIGADLGNLGSVVGGLLQLNYRIF